MLIPRSVPLRVCFHHQGVVLGHGETHCGRRNSSGTALSIPERSTSDGAENPIFGLRPVSRAGLRIQRLGRVPTDTHVYLWKSYLVWRRGGPRLVE